MKTLNTYMDNAWDDLASDNDWWKAVLALGLMNCVPIIGQIAMFGYLFDWAKEIAWGMKTPLSRKLNDIGRCFKYGFMALWVMLIWILPVVIAGVLLGLIPIAGPIICFIVEICAVLVAALSAAGAFRSIIYERIMPGLQFRRVFKMFRYDSGGFAQTFCIFLLNLPLLVAALFIMLLPTIPFINVIQGAATTTGPVLGTELVPLLFLGMLTVVVALVVWIAGACVSAFISTLYIRGLGYWMQQFEPSAWKTPSAPMPFEIEMSERKEEKHQEKADAKAALKAEKAEEKKAKKEAKKHKKAAEKDMGKEVVEEPAMGQDLKEESEATKGSPTQETADKTPAESTPDEEES